LTACTAQYCIILHFFDLCSSQKSVRTPESCEKSIEKALLKMVKILLHFDFETVWETHIPMSSEYPLETKMQY
jgi:hypothetical protein